MKLISLYIENFGGLSRYELQFQRGLTTINEPNGFGKTTLAEFIRAMLYGFPRKSKTLDKSKRQKYAPWNGGQYGGNLVFEHEGQRYRIERTFGLSPKGDTFALIDLNTNRKTDRFSAEIGTEIFGLDSESFERSTYLPQTDDDGPLATASIQAKLSDLVEDSDDIVNFDKAIAALKSGRSTLIPYRGNGGTVAEATASISQLQLELDRLYVQQNQLRDVREQTGQTEQRMTDIQLALEKVRREMTAASEVAADRMRQRQYAELRDRYAQATERGKAYLKKYPQGLPQEREIDQMEENANRLAILTAQEITTQADLQAQTFLQKNPALETHLPTAAELESFWEQWEEYTALQTKIATSQFAAAEFVQEERRRIQQLQDSASSGNPSGAIAALALGAAALIAGIVLMVMRKHLYGGIGLCIGLVALAAGVWLMYRGRSKKRAIEQKILAQQRCVDEKLTVSKEELAALQRAAQQLRDRIIQFLSRYFDEVESERFDVYLARLERNAQIFMQAQNQMQQYELRQAQHRQACTICLDALERFFTQYGLRMEDDVRRQLRQLRTDMRDLQSLQALKQELTGQLDQMKQAYGEILFKDLGIASDPEVFRIQEQQLQDKLEEATSRMLQLRQQIQQLRSRTEKIPELQEQLELWQQKKEKYLQRAKIIDDTIEFLQQARESMSVGYLGTVQSRFGDYLQQLEDDEGKYFIDTDIQVRLERMGQVRELAYFSAGQTDLVLLCMRLALVDALFKGQETFVILDDPFVNLDDTHICQAQKLLKKLALERQILYLTCHSSRAM